MPTTAQSLDIMTKALELAQSLYDAGRPTTARRIVHAMWEDGICDTASRDQWIARLSLPRGARAARGW